MARLLTNHDPAHIHAILGLIALLHFTRRCYLIFTIGDAFPNRNGWDILLVFLQGMLPISSLLLPLPMTRNFKSPMIWPEFRLHSIVFANRHVIATIFWLWNPIPEDGLYTMSWGSIGMMFGLIQCTLWLASVITTQFGCQHYRTTNAMPYDKYVPDYQIVRAKRFYGYAQFMATAYLFCGDPTVSYIPLSGIQSAPLLMTLVRKGKVSATTYHCIYAWTLILPLFVLRRVTFLRGTLACNVTYLLGNIAFVLRTVLRWDKYVTWTIATLTTLLLVRSDHPIILSTLSYPPLLEIINNTIPTWKSLAIPHILCRPRTNSPLLFAKYSLPFLIVGYFVVATIHVMLFSNSGVELIRRYMIHVWDIQFNPPLQPFQTALSHHIPFEPFQPLLQYYPL